MPCVTRVIHGLGYAQVLARIYTWVLVILILIRAREVVVEAFLASVCRVRIGVGAVAMAKLVAGTHAIARVPGRALFRACRHPGLGVNGLRKPRIPADRAAAKYGMLDGQVVQSGTVAAELGMGGHCVRVVVREHLWYSA